MHDYWTTNTFDLANRVKSVRDLLKPRVAVGVSYIRIGSAHDGGYIFADQDLKNKCVISCGVGDNVDFEMAMGSTYECDVLMYDHSIDDLPQYVPRGDLFKQKIGTGDGEVSLDDVITVPSSILKLDIEGAEWDVLSEATTLHKCSQIAMEAHWMQNLVFDAFYEAVVKALANLRRTHTPVYIHANNNQPITTMGAQPVPWVFEALFLNNDTFSFTDIVDPFEGLVVPNDLTVPEIGLSFP